MTFATAAIGLAVTVASTAYSNNRNSRISGAAQLEGYRQDLFNANSNLSLQIGNASLRSAVAGMNAEHILHIAAINETNIIAARDRNVDLLRTQQTEELRRTINEEVDMAGNIRLGYAASGVSVRGGSAKAVKVVEMRAAEMDRQYQDDITNKQILGYFQTETERAHITKIEGAYAAEAAIANAEFQNAVYLAEAETQVDNANNNVNESS